MKKIISLSLLLMPVFMGLAQSDVSLFAVVKGSNVNIRETPSKAGEIALVANYGDVFQVYGVEGDWVKIEESYGGNGWIRYVHSSLVYLLRDDEITPDVLEDSFTLVDLDGVFGFLDFKKIDSGEEVEYSFMIKSPELIESGGNGIIDSEFGNVRYNGSYIYQPESWNEFTDYVCPQAIFDAEKHLLFFSGYIWE